MLTPGVRLLRSRYKLVTGPVLDEGISQAWLGLNEDDNKFLIKVWPFDAERPDDLQRALWDAELRTLYRVGSSPGADDTILVIRDAGVDKSSRCFAMVLEAPGYESLGYVSSKCAPALRGFRLWSHRRVGRSGAVWGILQKGSCFYMSNTFSTGMCGPRLSTSRATLGQHLFA